MEINERHTAEDGGHTLNTNRAAKCARVRTFYALFFKRISLLFLSLSKE